MTRQTSPSVLLLSTLLTLLLVATSSAAATAAPKRFEASERLAMKLVNCLRTGGKVTTAGRCKGHGSGKHSKRRAPLKRSARISNKVAWPWAGTTARRNICGHSLAGSTVDKRFRKAGLKHRANGENIACGSSWSPRRMVIWAVRWWQRERRYNGWHWRQIKDPDFKVVGLAVAKHSSGRTRLVVNFYGKKVR